MFVVFYYLNLWTYLLHLLATCSHWVSHLTGKLSTRNIQSKNRHMSYNEGTGNQTQKSIHPSSIPFILPRVVEGGAYPWDTRHPGQSANPSQGTIAHPFTHYGRFGNADRNTTHDFGLVEETAEAQGRLFKGGAGFETLTSAPTNKTLKEEWRQQGINTVSK